MNIVYVQYGNIWNPFCHGGLSRANHRILRQLAKRHQVTVYTGLIDGPGDEKVLDDVGYIQCCRGSNRWTNRSSFIRQTSKLKCDNADIIVHIWDRYAPSFVKASVPIILELRSDFLNMPSKFSLIEPLAISLFKKRIQQVDYLISLTQYLHDSITPIKNDFKDYRVIPNGIDDELFENQPVFSEEHILFLGRLDMTVKGIDTLLKAYKASGVQIPLKLAGDGADKVAIERMVKSLGIENQVELVGWVDGEQKMDLLARAALVCLPTRAEGLSMVPLEAMAFGKTIVTTKIGGMSEVVKDRETGWLIEVDDVNGLSEAIKALIGDESLRNEYGQKALKRSEEYKLSYLTEQREKFFESVINRT